MDTDGPVSALTLALAESRRREAAFSLGPCRSGCSQLDDYVLIEGGFARGSVVGISSEDEFSIKLGLQVAQNQLSTSSHKVLVITPRPNIVMRVLRSCEPLLDRVMLSCVFDLAGVMDVLGEGDGDGAEALIIAIIIITHPSLLGTRESRDGLARRLRRAARGDGSPLVMLLEPGGMVDVMVDLHLVCGGMPGEHEMEKKTERTTVATVTMDEVGVWEGRGGPRRTREHRWTALRCCGDAVEDAFEEGKSCH